MCFWSLERFCSQPTFRQKELIRKQKKKKENCFYFAPPHCWCSCACNTFLLEHCILIALCYLVALCYLFLPIRSILIFYACRISLSWYWLFLLNGHKSNYSLVAISCFFFFLKYFAGFSLKRASTRLGLNTKTSIFNVHVYASVLFRPLQFKLMCVCLLAAGFWYVARL